MGARPRLLDLFCGGGGCSVGYHRAGFDVTGVDIAPQPTWPFLDVYQSDALAVLADVAWCREFDVVHASPPCQLWSPLAKRTRGTYHDLITPVREALHRIGRPWVIENVAGAPLDGVTLCGSMFGLADDDGRVLRRHRVFEADTDLPAPPPDACTGREIIGVYGTGGAWTRTAPGGGGVKVSGAEAAALMGVTWTDRQSVLAQAIPPAYAEWVGAAMLARLD